MAAPVHMVAYLGLSGAVNAVAHTFGRRPYDSSATNVQWLAFLTAGAGLHNNHHAAPTSARFSLGRFEFAPALVQLTDLILGSFTPLGLGSEIACQLLDLITQLRFYRLQARNARIQFGLFSREMFLLRVTFGLCRGEFLPQLRADLLLLCQV